MPAADTTLIAANRRARRNYDITETLEAGIVLHGSEVKSLRQGRASLVDGYATSYGGELYLEGVHIPEYTQGTWTNHSARRRRKLLLHREEMDKLVAKAEQAGHTIIPLSLYFKDGRAKVELGVGKGRKLHDKREVEAKRDADREIQRALAQRSSSR